MKFLSYRVGGRATWGAVTPDGVSDLGPGSPSELAATLAAALGDFQLDELIERAATIAATESADRIEFLPVIPAPGKILCVGLNYRAHAAESGRDPHPPEYPLLFTRFADSQVGHLAPLVRPRVSHRYDYEGELAIVIGRAAHHVRAEQALEYVAGYACFNDGSIRDWQRHSSHFTAGKNFRASGSFGPWLATREEIPEPAALELTTRLNGREVQRASVSDLIFDVPALVAYISTFAQLMPGDVIATGTPSGVGAYRDPKLWLQPGDAVEVEIDRIGVLRNPVIDEAP
jgi:2-keto-4-pentenoate hydratase/2-oxohepta-3-ene-1,7-dioic acid hydratase in catechol pathway